MSLDHQIALDKVEPSSTEPMALYTDSSEMSAEDHNDLIEQLEQKRKQLDEEIKKFVAVKEEEFSRFRLELTLERQSALQAGLAVYAERETKTALDEKSRSCDVDGVKNAEDTPNNAITKNIRGDRTPPHEREIELQGLFTPRFLPLLDGNLHREISPVPYPSQAAKSHDTMPNISATTSSVLPGSLPGSQPAPTSPNIPSSQVYSLPRSSALLNEDQSIEPPRPLQRSSSDSAAISSLARTVLPRLDLHRTSSSSSTIPSSLPSRPLTPALKQTPSHRASTPKHVKFKFNEDDIPISPSASYDQLSQTSAMSHHRKSKSVDSDGYEADRSRPASAASKRSSVASDHDSNEGLKMAIGSQKKPANMATSKGNADGETNTTGKADVGPTQYELYLKGYPFQDRTYESYSEFMTTILTEMTQFLSSLLMRRRLHASTQALIPRQVYLSMLSILMVISRVGLCWPRLLATQLTQL
jgi:hypothetical protein